MNMPDLSNSSQANLDKDIQARVSRWVRPAVQELKAYAVPNADGLVKLDAMENPYCWPDALVAEWIEVLKTVELNRYPEPQADKLKALLRQHLGLADELGLVLGNGSDELIQILQLSVGGAGRCVLAPTPSFVMYELTAVATGTRFIGVPLTQSFELNVEAMLKTIEQHNPAVIFIAYPNNPTGNLFRLEDIDKIITATDGLVVIDEAYEAYAESSYLSRIESFPNLLVMRTLSKLGLAGLRLGMLMGPKDWLAQFEKLRLPYNINTLSQISGEFSLRHKSVFVEQVENIRSERELLLGKLAKLAGVRVYPSKANFILFKVAERASSIYAKLLADGVLIKKLDGSAEALKDCLRVTVGTPAENCQFMTALQKALIN
ncbi:histidinol-phosphate transaminase [Pseudomonadota bacterium]